MTRSGRRPAAALEARLAATAAIRRRALVAALLGTAGLAGAAGAELQVVTTTTDLASIARAVGGDRVEVLSLAAGRQDPHFVDAKPSFLLKLQRADLFVQVGLDLEAGWAPTLLANARNARILPGGPGFVDASAGIERLEVPTAADRSAGDIHAYGNPHYWLDPRNGAAIARNIAAGLERVDPEGAAEYRQGLAAFEAKLEAALERWRAAAAPLAGVPVVAYHNLYPYLARRFGFRTVAFVEPKPGIPPSGRYVAELAERMKREGVRIVVTSPYDDVRTAKLLAELSGARIVTLAGSVEGVKEAGDYLALFDENLKRLLGALEG